MKTFFTKLHYSEKSLTSLLLLPFSIAYGLIIAIRNFLYDKNLLKSVKLPTLVVSIGNLTTGGTGKTPITCEIANYYKAMNKKVAVISRGYGGKLNNKNTNIISDGEKIFYNAEYAGDEPYWIAKNALGTVVITGKDRIKSGKLAIEKFKVEVLLLDDGFQHRKLYRDINIALVDAEKHFGNGFILPAGPLREPISNIKRADKIVLVKKSQHTPEKKPIGPLKNAVVCELTLETISGAQNVIAFSGIGQPESFFNAVNAQNINIISKKVFPDHYLYTKQDIIHLLDEAKDLGAEAMVTTEKDMVKIEGFVQEINSQIPVYALKLRVKLDLNTLLGTN